MTTDLTPEFTTSLRGYDRIQVDDYVDTLREWLDAATARMQAAEADAVQLHDQMLRLPQRVAELESDAGQQAPRSLSALGDRVARILALAEESAQAVQADAEAAATDTVIKAQQEAEELIGATRSRQVEAEAWLAQTTRQADQLVAQAEERAGMAAAQLTSDASARATAVDAEAQQRARDLVAHAEAEAARISEESRTERATTLQELAARREELMVQIGGLETQRDEVLAALTGLRESLHRTIGQLPSTPLVAASPAPAAGVETDTERGDHADIDLTVAEGTPPARARDRRTHAARPDDTQLFDQNEAQEAAGSQ
jgi:cell division septum initiation protein DivIVA